MSDGKQSEDNKQKPEVLFLCLLVWSYKEQRWKLTIILHRTLKYPVAIYKCPDLDDLSLSHLISAGGEFDFSLVRLPAHDRELGQLRFL